MRGSDRLRRPPVIEKASGVDWGHRKRVSESQVHCQIDRRALFYTSQKFADTAVGAIYRQGGKTFSAQDEDDPRGQRHVSNRLKIDVFPLSPAFWEHLAV